MRRLIRLTLLIAAFLGGCHLQHRLAVETCQDLGGRWVDLGAIIVLRDAPEGWRLHRLNVREARVPRGAGR